MVMVVYRLCIYVGVNDINVGDVVVLSSSELIVRRGFDGTGYRWDEEMIPMLGNSYTVLEILRDDTIAVKSPYGSQQDKFYFPIIRHVISQYVHRGSLQRTVVSQAFSSPPCSSSPAL